MNLVTATLENIKLSLRIDQGHDDELIMALLESAKQYVKDAIDSTDTNGVIEGYKQYDWAVSLLTQHWYDGRSETTKEHIPTTVQALLQQMRGKYYASK
ncbi:head-tail connector protein [Lysinibacillus sp. FSL W8-0992]|uniref:head-tail connector protein n=1 Tax=Lysinibacillus sp. FSL W8-0992 TaxID=2954643 RepID=UPI0030F8753E